MPLVVWTLGAVVTLLAGPARGDRAAEVESLRLRALEYQARGTIESRRMAAVCLERATALAPGRGDLEVTLGRLYFQMGFLRQARGRFERAERLDARDADAQFGLGLVWRRDWLKYLDRVSLDRAVQHFSAAARLRPGESEFWLQLVPLEYERDSLVRAAAAAERALAAAPGRPEAELAVAYTSFRLGRIEPAEAAFRRALSGLPEPARVRFEDIGPVATEEDTAALRRMPRAEQTEFLRRFWRGLDPDLASPENEAQLEYWSRVAQAFFLFFDARRQRWDERGEFYVRYGPPERTDYNPVGARDAQVYMTGPPYPLNSQVWSYPGLGMQVTLHDRLLTEDYMLPVSLLPGRDPRPDPAVLARREDLIVAPDGRGVFPLLPPGTEPRPASGVVARFSGERGPRIFAQLLTPGTPDERLEVEWVVLDSTMAEVARARRAPGASPCDPTTIRSADFAAELPPGRYQVGFTLRDGAGRRGVVRAQVELAAAPPTLTLSDAVVTCGRPDVSEPSGAAPPAVRLEASPQGVVEGAGPLTVYFEIYDLQPDDTGVSRFEYEATVRSAERDSRLWLHRLLAPRPRIPVISAARQEEHAGNLRRQFMTIPIAELPAGRYRLDILVRDLRAGTEVATAVGFVKVSAPAGGS